MRTGVFTEKVTLNDGTEIPQGTVCEIEEIYSFVLMDGEERVLNESIIERDGTLKMPYITCDDKLHKSGEKLEVLDCVAAVRLPCFCCAVSADSIMLEHEGEEE